MIIKLIVEGGSMKPGPTLSQKLGPTGINMGQVISKVNDATKPFAGMKVPVEIDLNIATKDIKVQVLSPPASELLKRELGLEKASGDNKKIKVGNASIEQIISVAKAKYPNMLARDLKHAVKSIAGTCISAGILIENRTPQEIILDIDDGKYDKEISEINVTTHAEKRKQLDSYFAQIKAQQEKLLKQEAAEKEAAAAAAAPAEAQKTEEKEAEAKEEAKRPARK